MNLVQRAVGGRRPQWFLPVAVGLALRAVWLAATAHPPRTAPILADPAVYLTMADHAYDGHWLTGFWAEPTSFLSVGYPALLAIVRYASGGLLSSWGAALLVNLGASVALVVAAGRLAGIVTHHLDGRDAVCHRAMRAAAWMMACLPDAIVATGLVMTELVAVAVLLWALIGMHSLFLGGTWARPVAVGVLLGAAVFLRPSWALLLVLAPTFVVLHRRAVKPAALLFICAMLVVAPAAWNNQARVHAGVGLTSAIWMNICDGATRSDGGFSRREECEFAFEGILPPVDREERSVEVARSQAVHDIRAHPFRWLLVVPLRLGRAFGLGGWGVEVSRDWSQHLESGLLLTTTLRVSQLGFLLAAAAGVAGLVRAVRCRRVVWWLVVSTTVGSLFGVAVSFGQTRFGWPMMAAVFIPYGAAFVALTDRRTDALSVGGPSALVG